MNRLFTFGCSFTSYFWPTWADILGKESTYYQNWGQPGAGNQYIFCALIECIKTKNIRPDDTIIIMWSHPVRIDNYQDGKWITKGNPANHDVTITSTDIRGNYIKDFSLIYAACNILKSLGCNWYFTSMTELSNTGFYLLQPADNNLTDLFDHYNDIMSVMRPSVHKALFNEDWGTRPRYKPEVLQSLRDNYTQCAGEDWPKFDKLIKKDFNNIDPSVIKEIIDITKWNWPLMIQHTLRADIHPTPLEHLEFVKKIFPEFLISKETEQWVGSAEPWALAMSFGQSVKIPREIFNPVEYLAERW